MTTAEFIRAKSPAISLSPAQLRAELARLNAAPTSTRQAERRAEVVRVLESRKGI